MRARILSCLVCAAALAGCDSGDEGDPIDVDEAEMSRLYSKAWEEQEAGPGLAATCSGVVVPDTGPFDRVVALTFDDGPNPQTTPLVLNTLRTYGIPATFFINGTRVSSAAAEALVDDVAADPDRILGNHTWSHPNMTTLTPDVAARQIDDNTAVIVAAGEPKRFFRFPYGSASCDLTAAARGRGYTITGWHIDSADWCFAPDGVCPATEFQHVDDDLRQDMPGWVMRQVERRQGGIILFHDIHAYTASQLPGIIERLLTAGYSFTSIDDASLFPTLNAPPPPLPAARTTANLNLRTGPGTQYTILLVMPLGSTVSILSGPTGGWYQIKHGSTIGWASATYLQLL